MTSTEKMASDREREARLRLASAGGAVVAGGGEGMHREGICGDV